MQCEHICRGRLRCVALSALCQWYYPQLVPWKHYVPVKNDLSDLASRVRFVLDPANDRTLQQMASDSTALASKLDIRYAAEKLRGDLEAIFNQ